jgi:hypothetical protein
MRGVRRGPSGVGACLSVLIAVSLLPSCERQSETLRWEVAASSGSDLTLRAAHGDCDNGPHAHVSETASSVTIKVTTTDDNNGCDDALRTTLFVVHLKHPLGDRILTGCADGIPDCTTYSIS